MYQEIKQAIQDKIGNDIVIIGKGSSIDKINLSILRNYIVINVNDSEVIFPGDISVFHHDWVLDALNYSEYRCTLYVTNRNLPKGVKKLNVE